MGASGVILASLPSEVPSQPGLLPVPQAEEPDTNTGSRPHSSARAPTRQRSDLKSLPAS